MNYEALRNWRFEPDVIEYDARDAMLYALGVGIGHDPLDERQLRFVTERELRAVPTMACVLGSPGLWLADTSLDVNWVRVLNGEQDVRLFAPLPATGRVAIRNEIVAVADKGIGRGALVKVCRTLTAADDGRLLAEIGQILFLRDEGGYSAGAPDRSEPIDTLPPIAPQREPDDQISLPSASQAALIYRLSGDYTPLHSDPAVAMAAGFARPILHGLCTLGMACHAVLACLCEYDERQVRRVAARFKAPVYPGEVITVAFYRDTTETFRFRATVAERGVTVLDNGLCELGAAPKQ